MKQCFKCEAWKPHAGFYRHSAMGDGYLGKCKECVKADVKANRDARRAYYSLYEKTRTQTPERKRTAAASRKRYRTRHPEKIKARHAVSNAIRNGRLVRLACSVCGSDRAQAHHDDYSRPLDVRWMCFRCHREQAHGQVVVAAPF